MKLLLEKHSILIKIQRIQHSEVYMTTANKTSATNFYKDLEAGDWNNKPVIVINPFKLKEAKSGFKFLAIMATIFLIFSIWYQDSAKFHLAQAQHQLNNDTIKPEMKNLADSGKTSAILWMAENYPQTEQHRLNALIDQKNSDAMMLKAQLIYRADKDLSLKYIKAAALEGNASAVKFLSDKNPNDIGLTKFFTEYVFK